MPKYIIERTIPNAGQLTVAELQDIARRSCAALASCNNPCVQWVHSYVTEDKIYCVYMSANKELVQEHAKCGGFPCDKISEVNQIFDGNWASKMLSSL